MRFRLAFSSISFERKKAMRFSDLRGAMKEHNSQFGALNGSGGTPRCFGEKEMARSAHVGRAPRCKHLEDEETNRDLFGVVRSYCTRQGCSCKQYVKKTCEYTIQPGEVGKRRHPHNDPDIVNCSACGCKPEDHAIDCAMNEKVKQKTNKKWKKKREIFTKKVICVHLLQIISTN